jgi:hypothetical protein
MFSIARLPQRAEIPIIARAFDIVHRLLDSFDMLQTSSRCNRHENYDLCVRVCSF